MTAKEIEAGAGGANWDANEWYKIDRNVFATFSADVEFEYSHGGRHLLDGGFVYSVIGGFVGKIVCYARRVRGKSSNLQGINILVGVFAIISLKSIFEVLDDGDIGLWMRLLFGDFFEFLLGARSDEGVDADAKEFELFSDGRQTFVPG